MAERQRLLDQDVAIAVVAVVMQVGAAEAGAADADLEVVGAWGEDGAGFLVALSACVGEFRAWSRTIRKSLAPCSTEARIWLESDATSGLRSVVMVF